LHPSAVIVMRLMLLNPIVLVATAACGLGICQALGVNPHLREMLMAFAGVLAAVVLAGLPQLLSRGSSQLSTSQAALVGTLIHMFISVAIAGGILVVSKPHMSFTYWMSTFYWVTLVVLAIASVQAVKAAPKPAGAAPKA
jgi:hypothetical protein